MNLLRTIILMPALIFYIRADQSAILEQIDHPSILNTPCLIKLLKKYIQGDDEIRGTTAVISAMIHQGFQQAYLLKGIHQSEAMSVMMKNPNVYHYSAVRMKEKAKVYLIFLSNADEILEHLPLLKRLPTYNTYAKMIVCFPTQMHPEEFEIQRKKSVNTLFENDFFDIFVLGNRYDTTILESYTTFPYDNENCARKVNPIQLVDICQLNINETVISIDEALSLSQNDSKIQSFEYRKFYPKLPEHITGCEIPVTVSNFEPYVVIDPRTKKIEKGLEVMMINTTFKALGANVKFNVQDSKVRYYRTSLDNKTGVYADLVNKKSTFMCGGFKANLKYNRTVQSSISYASDDVTWCVHPADLAPAWLNTFYAYSGGLWLAIGISIGTSGILLFIFIKFEKETRHQNLAWSCLSIFGTFVSMFTVKYDPKMIFIRIFMASLLFAGINLWAAYTSSLINILTSPRLNKQISTVPEAIDAGMTFYGSVNYLDFITANKMDEPGYNEVVQRYKVCESAAQCFEAFSKDKNSAIATSRIQASHNVQSLNIDKYCFDARHNLYEYDVSTLSYPYHHLLPLLNEMIGLILQSGLLIKWQNDVEEEKNYKYKSSEIKLTLEHLQGAFVMLGIGSLLAIIAFIIEWIYFVHKNGKQKALEKVRQI